MSRTSRAVVLALSLAAALAIPTAASASTIKAAGSAYTGNVNVRLSSSNATLVATTGTVTCTSASGTNPRLGSFGEGAVTSSSISTTAAAKGTLSRISFGNPLLANSTNTHDANTTAFTTFATVPNATPRCSSTVSATSGGCVAEGRPTSPNNTIAAQDVSGGVQLSLTTTVSLACKDSSGGDVFCNYTTGATPGTPGPITSGVIPYTTSGTAAATAQFTSQPVYRSSGSSLCPSTARFNASYQLYTGTVYPGGSGVYVTNP